MINTFKMKLRNFTLIFVMMISIAKMNPVLGVEKEKIKSIDGDSKKKGNGLHRLANNNYIVVYFRTDLSEIPYDRGFIESSSLCSSREYIDHLVYKTTEYQKISV